MRITTVLLAACLSLTTGTFGRELITERGMMRLSEGHLKKRAFGNFGGGQGGGGGGGSGRGQQGGNKGSTSQAATTTAAATTTTKAASTTAASSAAASASSNGNGNNNGGNGGNNNNGGNGGSGNGGDPQSSLTLDASQVQKGLELDGQQNQEANQVSSATSSNNFINFCLTRSDLVRHRFYCQLAFALADSSTSQPLTNGAQVKTGSCNGTLSSSTKQNFANAPELTATPMGVIAAQTKMPSCKFISPKNLDTIAANKDFTISMAIKNLSSINSAANHQPVLVAVAQHGPSFPPGIEWTETDLHQSSGSLDDVAYFTVK
ncbi:hypothetical protein P7C70_g1522, partial [Phenoliferia sp. Uapishka_3]